MARSDLRTTGVKVTLPDGRLLKRVGVNVVVATGTAYVVMGDGSRLEHADPTGVERIAAGQQVVSFANGDTWQVDATGCSCGG